MEYQNLINFLILLILLYITYLSKYFLPSYFKKKAENLAQLEDIEELTTKIKEIEIKFEERTHNIKSQLDFSNNILLGLHNEERQSLIIFHNELYNYYNFLTDITFKGADLYSNLNLDLIINERSLLFDNIFIKKSNINLFTDDDNGIDEIGNKCIDEFLNFSSHFLSYLQAHKNLNSTHKPNENFEEENQRIYFEKLNQIQDKHKENVNALIDKVGPLLSEITQAIKKHLISKSIKPIA